MSPDQVRAQVDCVADILDRLANHDPTDVAAAVSLLPLDDPVRCAIALGLAINDNLRTYKQTLRGVSLDVHDGAGELWQALAGREPRAAVLAHRSQPATPVRCTRPGCRAVLSVPHPLPDLRSVRCPAHPNVQVAAAA